VTNINKEITKIQLNKQKLKKKFLNVTHKKLANNIVGIGNKTLRIIFKYIEK